MSFNTATPEESREVAGGFVYSHVMEGGFDVTRDRDLSTKLLLLQVIQRDFRHGPSRRLPGME